MTSIAQSGHPDAALSAVKGSGGPALLWRGHRDDSNMFEREWGESTEIGPIPTNEMTVASRLGRDR